MKKFSVYQHPVLGYEAVKQGFSWPAFIFSWIWALTKKLWLHGILMGCFDVLLMILAVNIFADPFATPTEIILWIARLFFGFRGNAWRASNLKKRGYGFAGIVDAEDEDIAISWVRRFKVGAAQ